MGFFSRMIDDPPQQPKKSEPVKPSPPVLDFAANCRGCGHTAAAHQSNNEGGRCRVAVKGLSGGAGSCACRLSREEVAENVLYFGDDAVARLTRERDAAVQRADDAERRAEGLQKTLDSATLMIKELQRTQYPQDRRVD